MDNLDLTVYLINFFHHEKIHSTLDITFACFTLNKLKLFDVFFLGTKAGGIGQAYQQQPQSAQQQQQQQQQGQLYMTFDPSMQANYLAAAVANPGAAMQRGPSAPVQSNVAAGLPPSSSFYSGSTGTNNGACFPPSWRC